jgi:ABC-type Fe3+ transport system permease subunit
VARYYLRRAIDTQSGLLAESLLAGAGTGLFLAGLALVVCWLARGTRSYRTSLLVLVAVAWAIPGPIVGIGLKRAIFLACSWTNSPAVAVALYYGPSPLPLCWAYALRFFPYAVALLWPVVRMLPQELLDSAELDGASPGQRLWYLVVPLTWLVGIRAGLAVAILSLGELSTSKLVETPGSYTFTHEVFNQMHYGVGNDLAALCLLAVAAAVIGAAGVLGLGWLVRRRARGWVGLPGI